jgi:ketosteroid isomerase-like protein
MTSNLEKIERVYATYDEEGRSAADGLSDGFLHPDVEFSPFLARELDGRTYRGREEVLGFFDELESTFSDLGYPDRQYRAVNDDLIVMFTQLVGTAQGSTVPIAQDLGVVFEFDDGLARRMTAFGSHDEALRAAQEKHDA